MRCVAALLFLILFTLFLKVDEDLEAISEDEKKPAADDFNKDKMLKTKGQQKTSATKSKAKSKKF